MFCEAWGDGLVRENKSDGGPHEAGFLSLDCTKAKTTLGWRPKIGIKVAIDLVTEWSKEYISGGDYNGILEKQVKDFFGAG